MIAYLSRTGNVRYIVKNLNLPYTEIAPNLTMKEPYFLFTYTDGLGDIPLKVNDFLDNMENKKNLRGVIASGNINFGDSFCLVADLISKSYQVPIIRKIDLRGSEEDLNNIRIQYKKYIEVNSCK